MAGRAGRPFFSLPPPTRPDSPPSEWDMVLAGEAVEINPALGHGFKVREERGGGRARTRLPRHARSPQPPPHPSPPPLPPQLMTIEEWSARWKPNPDFPDCGNCGLAAHTREHHFVQTWCRGKKTWEAESLCVACGACTRREYRDPDFQTPEQVDAAAWAALRAGTVGGAAAPKAGA